MAMANAQSAADGRLRMRQSEMLDLLGDIVDIDSGSRLRDGVDAVGTRLATFLDGEGIAVDVLEETAHGNILIARTEGTTNSPILLLGHMDTVFPVGEAERRPFHVTDGRAYGPGVADMKSGLVMNAFVLAELKRARPDISCAMLMTVDEEIGSPLSRAAIEATARECRAVFNAEGARASGNIVSGRKGGMTFRLEVTGKAAHSGVNFADGVSAVDVIARKIVRLHELTRLDEGITLNVGVVGGGTTFNTVAATAFAEFDVRYVTNDQRDGLRQSILSIARAQERPGSSAELIETSEFFPLVETEDAKALSAAYLGAASAEGLSIAAEFTGGCADSGFTASVGTPTICGIGPVGGLPHTADEYIEVDSLAGRAQVLIRAIERISGEGPGTLS